MWSSGWGLPSWAPAPPTGRPGAQERSPRSSAASAVNRRLRSETRADVLCDAPAVPFFILTPGKNASFTFCRARSLNTAEELTNEAPASAEGHRAAGGEGAGLPYELSPARSHLEGEQRPSAPRLGPLCPSPRLTAQLPPCTTQGLWGLLGSRGLQPLPSFPREPRQGSPPGQTPLGQGGPGRRPVTCPHPDSI